MSMENYIWCEKYRPKQMDDLVLSEETRVTFEKFIQDKEIPHLLLHGSPGSGKTSIAMILLSQIPCKSIILNASSKDRGIETMRTTIVDFAKSKTTDGRLKIVLLDEADGLSADAQGALRGTMESYSKSCRFVLTANCFDKMMPAIKSRCLSFAFSQFPMGDMLKLSFNILKEEGIEYDRRAVSTIVKRLYPDFRSIVNALQMCSTSGTFKMQLSASGQVRLNEVNEFILKGNLRKLREMMVGITDFTFIYKHLYNVFVYDCVEEENKPEIALAISQHLANDAQVADREINLCSCFISIMLILNLKITF